MGSGPVLGTGNVAGSDFTVPDRKLIALEESG
jgi:hypothetical protein